MPNSLPLCVDLDETFCKGDTLWEVAMSALRYSPGKLAQAVFGFLRHRSRSQFKARLSELANLDASHLPVRTEVREYVQSARLAGRRTLLVTGADQAIAEKVANAFGGFDEVHGSGGEVNLKGRNKAAWLVRRFGEGAYEYIGDCGADVPVWKSAGVARVVAFGGNIPARLRRQVPALEALSVPPRPAPWRILRPHQWVKNLLIFLPLLAAHQFANFPLWGAAVAAFLATSLMASIIYVLNDFLDVPEDRNHPEKRKRLIASGDIHFSTALGLVALCGGGAVALVLGLPPDFRILLGLYAVVALAYSLGLKRLVGVDLAILIFLYCLRVYLGGAATGIPISIWLTVLAVGIFGSLATMKRCAEISTWMALGKNAMPGRGYTRNARGLLIGLGAAFGILAIGLLPVYIRGEMARELYHQPAWLLGLVPLMAIGLGVMWKQALWGQLKGDPVTFALRSPINYVLLAAAAVVIWQAVG